MLMLARKMYTKRTIQILKRNEHASERQLACMLSVQCFCVQSANHTMQV
jgi:hypothetical protein